FDDMKYRFQFWDFKGAEKPENLSKYYFKGSSGALIFFDLSKPETFKIALKFIHLVKKLKVPYGVIGTKSDLIEEEELKSSPNFANKIELIQKEGAAFFRTTSSKVFENSEEYRIVFIKLIRNLLVKIINENFIDVFRNNLNLQILLSLNIHKELSLAELTHYVERSKATISRITRNLIKLGLVKAREAIYEKTPGSINKKYYSLSHNFTVLPQDYDFKTFDFNNQKDLTKLRETIWRKIYILSLLYEGFGQSLKDFAQKVPFVAGSQQEEIKKKFIETLFRTSMNLYFLNGHQYEKLQSLRSEFHSKLYKILEERGEFKKDYVFLDLFLPVVKMRELDVLELFDE
ncbi:MAG: hypothetical protein R3255_08830, partial [Candidatus Lokiarchaeia archaeon]|nr:hypothetical protein [Candidatus Lokiarchaeia archaeon]